MSGDQYADLPQPDEEPTPKDSYTESDATASVDSNGVLPSVEELVLDHDGQLGLLRADVDGLVGLVGDLLRKPPAEKPAPWNWKELDGPSRVALLTELRQWVDWYNGRYGVTADSRILGCWYRHGPVVEELIGVWIAWRAAYYGHKSPNDAPAYWHERILWPAIARITKSNWGLSACIPAHKDPRPKSEPSTDDEFAAFISTLDDCTHAPNSPRGAQTWR